MFSSARKAALPSATSRALDRADDALAGRRIEVRDARERRACVRCAAATIAAASGCSLPRSSAGGKAQHVVPRSKPVQRRRSATTCGLPSVSVPVLSTTSVSTFSMRSSASAFLISTPACAPRPTPTMIDIGVASPSAQGQAMISTRTRRRPARRRSAAPARTIAQATKASDARPRSPPARTSRRPDRPAAGSARGCAAPRPPSARSARAPCRVPTLLGAHDEAAGAVERAADDAVAGVFRHRHRFAGHHRFIDARSALQHARHRPAPFRRAARAAGRRPAPASSGISSSLPSARTRRAVLGARSSSARMAPLVCRARAQFQHLAEQHQHGDDRGRLEIDRRRAAVAAEGRRENAGRERRDDAVDVGRRRCRSRSA